MKKITCLILSLSSALFLSAAPEGKKKSIGEKRGFPNREELIKKYQELKSTNKKLHEDLATYQRCDPEKFKTL